MIHGDMTVTEFVMLLWDNKVKVVLVILAIALGPGLYDDWQTKRAAERVEADRKSVDTEASLTGMMLASAWESCRDIGILNDMERCATYEARLLQEQAAPVLAKMALGRRASFYRGCQRFHLFDYCQELLARSLELSIAQSRSGRDN